MILRGIFLAVAVFSCANAFAQTRADFPKKEPTKEEILKPLESLEYAAEDSFINKIARKVVFQLDRGPLFLLPIVDSSKDLGAN
ncbi:MAG: hypothetical protein NTW04_00060 [Elusimicrobia bacterium]|nr:hypothetical protein [Elusimicrobiota bacterium]